MGRQGDSFVDSSILHKSCQRLTRELTSSCSWAVCQWRCRALAVDRTKHILMAMGVSRTPRWYDRSTQTYPSLYLHQNRFFTFRFPNVYSMVLLIDNYDSFVYNLARYVSELGWEREVARNDDISLADIEVLDPTHIILSPGPCTPNEAGISNTVIEYFGSRLPILGVCLGHQCIGQVYGGKIVRAQRPMHGKTSQVQHNGLGVFNGLPNPLRVTRYHSLVISPDGVPPELVTTAYSPEGEIMAVCHRSHPVVGVQFHPEAVLTECGYYLLRNFLSRAPLLRPSLTGVSSVQ